MNVIKFLLRCVLAYCFGYMIGTVMSRAGELSDDLDRIGIFSQPDGNELIELCYEHGPCKHYFVKKEDLDKFDIDNPKGENND